MAEQTQGPRRGRADYTIVVDGPDRFWVSHQSSSVGMYLVIVISTWLVSVIHVAHDVAQVRFGRRHAVALFALND